MKPHMSMVREGPPGVNWWRCTFCDAEGELRALTKTECTEKPTQKQLERALLKAIDPEGANG